MWTYIRGQFVRAETTSLSLGSAVTLDWDEAAINEKSLIQVGKELNRKCCPADLRMDIDRAINACDVTWYPHDTF